MSRHYESGSRNVRGQGADAANLVISGGTVVTPQGMILNGAVAISDDTISYVGPADGAPYASETVNAKDAYVLPGLLDLHTHVYFGSARLGINPDKVAAVSGVTTWVDAGTAGAGTFEGLLLHVRERTRARILPFLNMSYIGLTPAGMLTREIGELWDPAFADLRAVLRTNEEFPGEISGIKVRASSNALGDNASSVLPQAREAADEIGVPLMIHIGMAPPTLDEVLPYLHEGDILTHCFHPHAGGRILDSRGRVRDSVKEAVRRGVLLDVGHGVASMSHLVAERALQDGVMPDSLSSDIHAENIGGPIRSMLTVLEMFLALGMSVEEVFDRATSVPADAVRRPDLGRLTPGSPADIAILRISQSERIKQDSIGHELMLKHIIEHQSTLVGGQVVAPFDDGRSEFRDSPWLTRFGADPHRVARN